MIRISYMNVHRVTEHGAEIEVIGRTEQGKVRRPRLWLSDDDLRSLLGTMKSVRRRQRTVASLLTDRADATTQAGLAE